MYFNGETDTEPCPGFGIDSSAFDDEKSEKIRKMARQFSGADITASRMLKGLIVMVMPRIAKALRIESFDRESLEFFADIVKQTVKSRKEEKTKRNDMVDLLSEALRGEADAEAQLQVESELEVAKPSRRIPSIPADQGKTFFGAFPAGHLSVTRMFYKSVRKRSENVSIRLLCRSRRC